MAFWSGWLARWKASRHERLLARSREGALAVREQLRAQFSESLSDFRALADGAQRHMAAQHEAAERTLEILRALERASTAAEEGITHASHMLEKLEEHGRTHVRLLAEAAHDRRELADLLQIYRDDRRRSTWRMVVGFVLVGLLLAGGFAYVGRYVQDAGRHAGALNEQLTAVKGELQRLRLDLKGNAKLDADRETQLARLLGRQDELLRAMAAREAARAAPPPPAKTEPADTAPAPKPSPSDGARWYNPFSWF
jgi:hypothetical protein